MTHHVYAVITDMTLQGSGPVAIAFETDNAWTASDQIAIEYAAQRRGGRMIPTDELVLHCMTTMRLDPT